MSTPRRIMLPSATGQATLTLGNEWTDLSEVGGSLHSRVFPSAAPRSGPLVSSPQLSLSTVTRVEGSTVFEAGDMTVALQEVGAPVVRGGLNDAVTVDSVADAVAVVGPSPPTHEPMLCFYDRNVHMRKFALPPSSPWIAVPFTTVVDVRRTPSGTSVNHSGGDVIVEFVQQAAVSWSGFQSTKLWRIVVVQRRLGWEATDALFKCILSWWRRATQISSTATPRSDATPRRAPPANTVHLSSLPSAPAQNLSPVAEAAAPLRFVANHTADAKLLENCASLEQELRRIQARREQRQRLLAQHEFQLLENFDESAHIATPPLPVAAPPVQSTPSNTSVAHHALIATASLCPHCGVYGTADHPSKCANRPVICGKCSVQMPWALFAGHAASCAAAVPATPPPSQGLPQPDRGAQEKPAITPSRTEGSGSAETQTQTQQSHAAFADIPRVDSIAVKRTKSGLADAITKEIRFADEPPRDPSRTPSRKRLTTFVDANLSHDTEEAWPSPNHHSARRASSSASISSPSADRIVCPWCKKRAPPDHPKKCADRVVRCASCNEEVFLRDKKAHRAHCRSAGSAVSTFHRTADDDDDGHQDDERLKRLASYRKEMESIRKGRGSLNNSMGK